MKPTILLTAAALALSAADASAQPPPAPEGEAASPQQLQGRFGGGAQRRAEMAADVHTILHIRPDQEQAFQTFMTELHRPYAPRENAATGAPPPPSPSPEVAAAYQSFSAVLTPDQQQVLAALRRLALDRPRWGGGHGGLRHARGGAPPEGEPQ